MIARLFEDDKGTIFVLVRPACFTLLRPASTGGRAVALHPLHPGRVSNNEGRARSNGQREGWQRGGRGPVWPLDMITRRDAGCAVDAV